MSFLDRLPRDRRPLIGLGVLAVVTVIVASMALTQYRTPTAPVATATPTSSATEASPTPTPAQALNSLAHIAALLQAPGSSVLVLGDGSGNEADEWVSVWAQDHLAADRTVSYAVWEPGAAAFASPTAFGTASDTMTVWNASVRSPVMSSESARVAKAWQPVGVVLLSYGHRQSADQISPELDAILAAIHQQDPSVAVAVLIQNPDPATTESTQRATTLTVQEWAVRNDLPTINIYDAFIADPRPRSQLVESDGSPTPAGSQLWAQTLADALSDS